MQIVKYAFQQHGDDRGMLVALEEYNDIPFEIKRVYYMYDTKEGVTRGYHAHKSLEQILIGVSTKFVYENLKLDADTVHPDIDGLIGAIRAKNLEQIAGHMGNVLETVTIPNYPVIAEIKDHMMEHGAVQAMMSGSGPTVFGLFANGDTAVAAYEAMRESNLAKQIYLTSIYNNAR